MTRITLLYLAMHSDVLHHHLSRGHRKALIFQAYEIRGRNAIAIAVRRTILLKRLDANGCKLINVWLGRGHGEIVIEHTVCVSASDKRALHVAVQRLRCISLDKVWDRVG